MCMSAKDIFFMGLKNLSNRKLRTMLTVVGVVIGSFAIIVMIAIGISLQSIFNYIMESLDNINVINVRRMYSEEKVGPSQKEFANSDGNLILNDKLVEFISKIEGVNVAIPLLEVRGGMTINNGKYPANVQILGIEPIYASYLWNNIEEGRNLAEGDKTSAVFGFNVINQFYDPKSRRYKDVSSTINLLTDKIKISADYRLGQPKDAINSKDGKIKSYNLNSIGVFNGNSEDWRIAHYVIVDMELAKNLINDYDKINKNTTSTFKEQGYEEIIVKVDNLNLIENIENIIVEDLGYKSTYSPITEINSLRNMFQSVQILLGSVGVVSLFIAAIGITNTMVMAAYERRKEIGVMKVIGASITDIKNIFLLEALLIGLIGGIFGVAFSLTLAHLVSPLVDSFIINIFQDSFIEIPSIKLVPNWLSVISLIFTSAIGVISGYSPAVRATRLSAMEAIRTS